MGIILDLYKKGTYCDTPYNKVYEITSKDINNNPISLSTYKDKVMVIANINSTSKLSEVKEEIEMINELKLAMKDKVEILIYPTNSLDSSELTKSEIEKNILNLQLNDQIKVFKKVSIKGQDTCELYKYLLRNSKLFKIREGKASSLTRNLSLFITDKRGKVKKLYDDKIESKELIDIIQELSNEEIKDTIKIRNDFIRLGKFI